MMGIEQQMKGKAGRPLGPSGKYVIEGKPVDVFTWRRYVRKKHAEMRLQHRIDNPQDIPELEKDLHIKISMKAYLQILKLATRYEMPIYRFCRNAIYRYYKYLKTKEVKHERDTNTNSDSERTE